MKMTSDAKVWHKKWSTWLALASASATGGLGAYALFPERVQGLVPDWALAVMAGIALLSAIGVPVATSVAQTKLKVPE